MVNILKQFKYTDKELDELINSIVVLIDTREKNNSHIIAYFDRKGINYKKKALPQCDYSFMIPANENLNIPRDLYFYNDVAIERKASLEEISNNFSKERDRFEKELSLAPSTKAIIIENADYSDIATGNYDTKYNRKSFIGTIHSFWFKYNVPFFFMKNKEHTGLFIKSYFQYYIKDLLK